MKWESVNKEYGDEHQSAQVSKYTSVAVYSQNCGNSWLWEIVWKDHPIILHTVIFSRHSYRTARGAKIAVMRFLQKVNIL